jgi:probable selenium-dependent hydroxylase accessory protein YqeC
VESENVHRTLAAALGVGGPQLVAFVGAGGKTTALQRLGVELAVGGSSVVATTTTAMFAYQLASLGPLVVADDDLAGAYARCRDALLHASPVALAKSMGPEEKVGGLAPREVDHLWSQRLATSILVEADGSRGLPLKAFGAAEPQPSQGSTVIVVVAGLDVLGQPLDAAHVHRAELLDPVLHTAMGVAVTPQTLAAVLSLQVDRVRDLVPHARIVVLLNKADTDARASSGDRTASHLLASVRERGRPHETAASLDRVVVGSLWHGVYRVVQP